MEYDVGREEAMTASHTSNIARSYFLSYTK